MFIAVIFLQALLELCAHVQHFASDNHILEVVFHAVQLQKGNPFCRFLSVFDLSYYGSDFLSFLFYVIGGGLKFMPLLAIVGFHPGTDL
jgi:hypothetical protein